jgi:tetratricopeptide (TPR) repeat protein
MPMIENSNRARWAGRTRRVLSVLLVLSALIGGCGRGVKVETPSEKIKKAWDLYRSGDFMLAIRYFQETADDPAVEPAIRNKALYGLGTTWALRRPDEDPVRAAACFKQVLQFDPHGPLASWSLLGLARLKHMVPVDKTFDTPQVLRAYQDVLDRYPGTLPAEEALVFQQSILLCTCDPGDARKVIDTMEHFIAAHPKSHYVSFAWAMIGKAWHTLQDPEKELQGMVRSYETQEVDPGNPFFENASTYWSIATFAEYEVGDFDTARKFYNKMLTEYPVDYRRFMARTSLQRMDAMEAKYRQELSGGRS